MWPSNILIIISAPVLLAHSLPSNVIPNAVQNDSSPIVQNEKYLQLFLRLATRAADRLIRLRNQTDKNHDCNRSRDNLPSNLEDPRTQSPSFVNSERSDEDDTQTQLFLSDSKDNETERTTSDAVVRNDEVSNSGTTQKSVVTSDTENATTSANASRSDAQSSESSEVDGIAERFFNPFNQQTLHASAPINNPINTENKLFAQTHKLLQSTLKSSKQLINDTLCLQYAQNLPSRIDDTSKIFDSSLDKLQENILHPRGMNSPSVLKQIVSSAINVVKSVIEKLPANVNDATLFKQTIPLNLEKLQAHLNNATLFDQIISREPTSVSLQTAEGFRKSPEDVLKSGTEFINALRLRINESDSQSHGNQSAKSNSEVIGVDKTNALERDNQETSTDFANNSEVQSNNGQSTSASSVNHETTLAPHPTLLPNFDDDKNYTENFDGAQNNLQNSKNVTNIEIPDASKEDDSFVTEHRPTSSHINDNQSESETYTRLIEKLGQIGELRDDLSKTTLQNIDDQFLSALWPVMNSDRP